MQEKYYMRPKKNIALFPAHRPGENFFGCHPAANKKIFFFISPCNAYMYMKSAIGNFFFSFFFTFILARRSSSPPLPLEKYPPPIPPRAPLRKSKRWRERWCLYTVYISILLHCFCARNAQLTMSHKRIDITYVNLTSQHSMTWIPCPKWIQLILWNNSVHYCVEVLTAFILEFM